MRDRGRIVLGLLLFLLLATFPIWYNLGSASKPSRPELQLPINEQKCVKST